LILNTLFASAAIVNKARNKKQECSYSPYRKSLLKKINKDYSVSIKNFEVKTIKVGSNQSKISSNILFFML